MLKDNIVFHAHDNSMDVALDQAITTFMVEAAGVCAANHWRVHVTDSFGSEVEYTVDFSTGGVITEEEIAAVPEEDRMKVKYNEVTMNDHDGLPDIKLRVAEITFIAKEDDGTRNRAVESATYRTFAELYREALENYNKTKGKKFIL